MVSTANGIYKAICSDATACAKIRREFTALSVQLLTDPNASTRITSATVNGQTFTASASFTNAQRHELLKMVVDCLDRRALIPTTLISTF